MSAAAHKHSRRRLSDPVIVISIEEGSKSMYGGRLVGCSCFFFVSLEQQQQRRGERTALGLDHARERASLACFNAALAGTFGKLECAEVHAQRRALDLCSGGPGVYECRSKEQRARSNERENVCV